MDAIKLSAQDESNGFCHDELATGTELRIQTVDDILSVVVPWLSYKGEDVVKPLEQAYRF